MNFQIRYPSISLGNADEQLRDIRSYLFQLTDTLNACDTSALAVMNEISSAINAGNVASKATPASVEGRRLQEYSSLRSLIIKTADYAAQNSESIKLSMSGNYVAVSDFGKYFETATVEIDGNPWGITQLYRYSSGIDAENTDYRVDQENYIKSGLLYYDESSQPVYGVGVGTIYGNVSVYGLTTDTIINNAKTYYTKSGSTYTPVDHPVQEELSTYYERVMSRQSNQMYSTFTSDEMAFWSGSNKLAYMNTSSINFPNANITGGSIAIGGTSSSPAFGVTNTGAMTATSGKIANWEIGTDSLHTTGATWSGTTGMYFGASGLRMGRYFKVDSNGKITATNADLSGKITATSGQIAGWYINGNNLQNESGTIYLNGSTGAIHGVSISGSSVSGGTISGSKIIGNLYYGDDSYIIGNESMMDIHANNVMYIGTEAAYRIYLNSNTIYIASSAYVAGQALFCPYGSTKDLGSSTASGNELPWNNIYYLTSCKQVSDRNMKKEISYDMARYDAVFDALRPVSYKLLIGGSEDTHTGLIAQDVKEAILGAGLETADFGAYTESEDDQGNVQCFLGYQEFISLLIRQVQMLKTRVCALEMQRGDTDE